MFLFPNFMVVDGIFQALECALGPQHFLLHHVRSHAGECFNEFVDFAAKAEARKTLNMRRQAIDMRLWRVHFKQLWVAFQSNFGLPARTDGYLAVPAPDLPAWDAPTTGLALPERKKRKLVYTLSLASANVQALYRGPSGNAGKLHYLQQQMRHYRFNIVAIQEARSEQGLSQNANILRLCTGHAQGQYGMELWIDLELPFARDERGRDHRFESSHFQVVHQDPRRLLVRCDARIWSFWILTFHAPHSGHC